MITIAFGTKPLEGTIFFAEAGGKRVRALLELDKTDAQGGKLVLSTTPKVRSVTTGFLIGLLGPSIKAAKSREAFLARVDARKCQPWFQQSLQAALDAVLPKAAPAKRATQNGNGRGPGNGAQQPAPAGS